MPSRYRKSFFLGPSCLLLSMKMLLNTEDAFTISEKAAGSDCRDFLVSNDWGCFSFDGWCSGFLFLLSSPCWFETEPSFFFSRICFESAASSFSPVFVWATEEEEEEVAWPCEDEWFFECCFFAVLCSFFWAASFSLLSISFSKFSSIFSFVEFAGSSRIISPRLHGWEQTRQDIDFDWFGSEAGEEMALAASGIISLKARSEITWPHFLKHWNLYKPLISLLERGQIYAAFEDGSSI